MPCPYSSARLGNVAACDWAASWRNTGQVSAGGPGISASTTRAPRASRRSTHASAASLASVSRPSARFGARRRRPIVRPARPRLGHRPSGQHRPERGDVGDRPPERPDGVEGGAEREHAVDRDVPVPRLEPDDLARGGREPDRAAGVGADPEVAQARRDRRGVPARRPAGRPPRPGPGCAPSRTTRSRRAPPRRTRRGSPCRRTAAPASSTRSTTLALRSGTWSAYTREP